ncbi:hypothetical protein EYF80_030293 [Liparis tanakae]|uniref:Uncharacterized protein n=1 Tax=Liparis tanakae TaxID=230148 RepID=A0A4Z2H0V8_9TELE|nr:hypothetical protein EYF80_030293 [Liparis tanakae]
MAFCGRVMRGKVYMAPCTGLQVMPGTVLKICSTQTLRSAVCQPARSSHLHELVVGRLVGLRGVDHQVQESLSGNRGAQTHRHHLEKGLWHSRGWSNELSPMRRRESPLDYGTADRVLHPLHVGVHVVHIQHLPPALEPVRRLLGHVRYVTRTPPHRTGNLKTKTEDLDV